MVEDSYWHTCWLCAGSARSAGSQAARPVLRCARGQLRDCIMVHCEVGCGGSEARQQIALVVKHLSGNGIAQQEVNKHLRCGWAQVSLCRRSIPSWH